MAKRRDARASHFPKHSALFLGVLLSLALWAKPVRAEPALLPHRPWIAGFGSLCDAGPLVCTRIDEIGFNARIDALLLTGTSQRGIGLVVPYGFSFGILEHLEGGIYTHSAIWGQPDGAETRTRFQQGPIRFAAKGVLWPWRSNPHQHFSVLLDFEYEARLPHFDGQNQLGLLTDLGALRAVANVPLGGVELGLSAGALFDWLGRYGTPELGVRLGWHLPFISDVKVFAEGAARGFLPRVNTDEPIPGALDPARPIVPSGVLGFGIASRQMRAVDFAMVVHVGFGDTAPFFLSLRFADIAWGKGYPRPQSMVVDAVREFATWVQEQVASIDPMFNDYCDMIDDPPPKGTGRSMNLVGHRTPDEQHCVWNGLWLKKYESGEKVKYWKNKRSTLLCHDEARNHCFAQRASSKEPWEPIENVAHTAVMRGDCIFEDADTKQRLTHFGTLSPDGRNCTDGTTTFRVGERTAYNPEQRQIDRGTQGTARQHPPLAYQGEPRTLQRLGTALGRGIERGQQQNKQHEEEDKAAAAAADAKIDSALKAAEEMTPTTLVNGVEAAAQEATEGIKHAAADPKGTFNRALDRIKQGIENTAGAAKDGIKNTAQAVNQGTHDAIDWSKKPAIDQAEDVLKLGGEKAATSPRDATTSVATGMATGGTVKLLGSVVGGLRTAGKLEQAGEAISDSKKARKALARAAKAEQEVAEHAAPAVIPTTPSNARVHGAHTVEAEARRATEAADTGTGGAQKLKGKDRKAQERARSLQEKHGDLNFEEPASEGWAKWQAKDIEKARGKDARRQVHDRKEPGEGDRSKRQYKHDNEDLE
jgi:hypothetical protein